MSRVFAALVIVGLLVGAAPASAQTGRVQGQIVDTAGKPIKGVVIKATNGDSPFDLTTTTDDKGRFALIGFRAGLWNFAAEAPGFVEFQNFRRRRLDRLAKQSHHGIVEDAIELAHGKIRPRPQAVEGLGEGAQLLGAAFGDQRQIGRAHV